MAYDDRYSLIDAAAPLNTLPRKTANLLVSMPSKVAGTLRVP